MLASPFDVRLGGFAGGLLNVVTKSGTNDFNGSLFGFVQDGRLAARGLTGRRLVYTTRQFGGTLSGPIVRDRIHFFVNADVQQRVVPDAGPLVTDTAPRATQISYDDALRFQNILRSKGLDAGSLGPDDAHLPAQDLFAKITMQLGDAGHLELSQRYAHADRRGFLDVAGRVDTVPLSSVSGRSRSTARTSRAIWTTLVGRRFQSEAIVSYERLWDSCQPNGTLPRIQVQLFTTAYLIAGPNGVCPTTAVDQSALELTENLTVGAGRHLVTVGSHAELLHFRDPLVQVSAGRWFFSSLTALEAGTATHYDRGLPPDSTRPPGARFHAITVGVYAQDRWAPTSRLTLTPGLRLDVPFLPDAVATNPGLEQSLGIDTGRLPSGNMLWSPRVGIKYDVGGRGTTIVRGGIGLFSGPPPYRWLGNAYRESGDESVVMCDGNITPTFVPGAQQGSTCTNGKGVTPRISFFDPGFKLPQNLKLAIGADRDVGAGVTAALDLLYTRALHQIYISDPNLGAPIGVASGEGGRLLYGTIDTAGKSIPRWRDTAFGEIYRVSNRSGDESVSLSAQLQKSFGDVLSLQASYAWSRARDRMSLVNFPSRANFSNTPLDGSLDGRHLRPSFFETPHKVSLGATLTAPHGLQLALLYLGASQPPYTYVVRGDVNADGIGVPGSLNNDIVYVPKNATRGGDIDLVVQAPGGFAAAPDSVYDRLEAFIERQPCLREQRGRIMKRGSCRNGWLDLLNARVSETLSAANDHHIEVIADIFNLPNLINSRWGRHRDVTTDPSIPLLRLRKYDTTLGRGRYGLETLSRGSVDNTASRWQVQLGLRYGF